MPIDVEEVDLDIGQAQGLLWAFDSLYVVVNSVKQPNTSGLYRLRDTNGDDKLDRITTLKQFLNRTHDGPATGEHGPHAVVLGPDQKLYVVAGNFTNLPDGVRPNSPARHWAEDLLLERMPDGKGHDPNIYAPGSWVCRTDPDGKTLGSDRGGHAQRVRHRASITDGEMFTFDSDMEWDIGTPWYRPTRICHVVSGGEFGWRNGSGKWPTYYPDSVPPVARHGPRLADGRDVRLRREVSREISARVLRQRLGVRQNLRRASQAGWGGLHGGVRAVHCRQAVRRDGHRHQPRRRDVHHDRRARHAVGPVSRHVHRR